MNIVQKVVLTAYLNEIADNTKAMAIGRGATYEGVEERTNKEMADAWQHLQEALKRYRDTCISVVNGSSLEEFDFRISSPNNTVAQEIEKKTDGKYEGF